MFSLFKRSEPEINYTDKVWKKTEYARKGMIMMAMLRLQHGKPCLLVNFFESEGESLTMFMAEHKLDFILLDETAAMNEVTASLYLVSASHIGQPTVSGFLKQHAARFSGEAFFSGHYPTSATEQTVLKNLTVIGYDKFVFCLSFDDPLLKAFGTPSILPLLEKLGMEDEEAIEHEMVTKSIQRAREKVETKVKREVQAKSPEEWFRLNVKG